VQRSGAVAVTGPTFDTIAPMTSVQGPGINRSMGYDASAERLVVREGSSYTFTLRDLGHRVLRKVTWSSTESWRWGKDYIYRGGTLLASQSPREGEGLLYHRCVMSSPSPSLPPSGVFRTWEPTNCQVKS